MKKIKLNTEILVEVLDDVSPNDLSIGLPEVRIKTFQHVVANVKLARVLDWDVVSAEEVK